jgi:hypothetical protein
MTRARGFEASADSGPVTPYLSLCCQCHRVIELSPDQVALDEARAVVGDLSIAFCHGCCEAALRMVDELGA